MKRTFILFISFTMIMSCQNSEENRTDSLEPKSNFIIDCYQPDSKSSYAMRYKDSVNLDSLYDYNENDLIGKWKRDLCWFPDNGKWHGASRANSEVDLEFISPKSFREISITNVDTNIYQGQFHIAFDSNLLTLTRNHNNDLLIPNGDTVCAGVAEIYMINPSRLRIGRFTRPEHVGFIEEYKKQ